MHGLWTKIGLRSNNVEILGVNNVGGIVGFYTWHGMKHGLELGRRFRRIDPPGGSNAVATGISDDGRVVAYMTTVAGGVESFARRPDGKYTKFSYPGSGTTTALAINDSGVIVGSYVDSAGKTHGLFLLIEGHREWQSFDETQADGFTRISGITVREQLIGSYRDASGVMHGFFCGP